MEILNRFKLHNVGPCAEGKFNGKPTVFAGFVAPGFAWFHGIGIVDIDNDVHINLIFKGKSKSFEVTTK